MKKQVYISSVTVKNMDPLKNTVSQTSDEKGDTTLTEAALKNSSKDLSQPYQTLWFQQPPRIEERCASLARLNGLCGT